MATPQPGRPAARPLPMIIFTLLCAGFGIAFLYWSASQLWYVVASRSWAQTDGLITESRYIDNGPRRDSEARIRYTYAVGEQTYEGGNLLPGSLAYDDATEEQKVQQYRRGKTVTVFYDPGDPASSSLERGVTTRLTYIGLVLGLAFFSYAVYLVVNLIRGTRPRL